jgi:hypothetical protein
MSPYTSYEKFFNPDQAQPVMTILKENGIPYEFVPVKQVVDQVLVGGGPAYTHEIKIPGNQFNRANRLLRENIQVNFNEVDPDYYLFSFEDAELIEILKQPDEWGRLDFALSRKILESRAIVYTNDELDALWNSRMETLAKPSSGSGWSYVGYALSILAAFIGIIVGLVYWTSTKTLPNGKRYYIYDEPTRKRGKNIFILSLIVTAIALTILLAKSYLIVSENWFEW